MTTQQFLKGLLMAVVGVIVAAFSATPINWIILTVTAVCTILTYAGKNLIAVLHSDSPAGSLSFVNIISALLILLGTGILEGIGLFIVNGAINWAILGKVVLSITFTYLGGTLFAPPYTTAKKKFYADRKYISMTAKGLIVFLFLLLPITLSAQGPSKWRYLTRPLSENLFCEQRIETPSGLRILNRIEENNTAILFKLNGAINAGALTYNSETKSLEAEAWIGAGPILSVRQYKADESGNAYERFGIGAGLLVGSGLTNIQLNQLKTILNFEIGRTFSIGYGYAAITDTPNKRHSLLFNARFDF